MSSYDEPKVSDKKIIAFILANIGVMCVCGAVATWASSFSLFFMLFGIQLVCSGWVVVKNKLHE